MTSEPRGGVTIYVDRRRGLRRRHDPWLLGERVTHPWDEDEDVVTSVRDTVGRQVVRL